VVIGAICRLLAFRLGHERAHLSGLSRDLCAWIRSYRRPVDERRWCALQPAPPPARSPFLPYGPLRAPSALEYPRTHMSQSSLAAHRSLRIAFATADSVRQHGYEGATVAEITSRAGVDGRTFYRSFADKHDAFATAADLLFRHLMAAAAAAFVTGDSWPECVWEAARALTQCLEQNPTLAHVSLIESHAAGPFAVSRAKELACAFTIFLQEGYRHEPRHHTPSNTALEASAAAVFELGYQQARRQDSELEVSGLLGHVVFIWLAPFLGAAETDALLDRKARLSHEAIPSSRGRRSRRPRPRAPRQLSAAT